MHLFKKLKKINPLANLASDGLISDIEYYIDSGSYVLNALLSGSIYKGFPGNRIVGFAGMPSAGKTYLTISILKNFQRMSPNNYVIYYDTEGRLTKEKLLDAGIIGERYFHTPISNLEQFKFEFIKGLAEIKSEYGFADTSSKRDAEELDAEKILDDTPEEKPKPVKDANRPNFFFVLDSLSQAGSEKEERDALKDKTAADMGLRAKTIKSIFRNVTMDLNILKFPMIVTSHVYNSMQQYQPAQIAGGTGLQYAASIIIECLPTKDSITDGAGKRDVVGTKIRCILRKSELTKQWKSGVIEVNYSKGLERFSGLFDICFDNGIIKREGKKYLFPDGQKFSLVEIEEHPEKCYSKESLDAIDREIDKIFSYGKGGEVSVNTEETDKEKLSKTLAKENKDIEEEVKDVKEIFGEAGETADAEEGEDDE